jgi:hypothetical protein
MTMKVTITKDQTDGHQARVRFVDKVGDASRVSEAAVLRKEGEGISVVCTSTRSIKINEEPLEAQVEAPAASQDGAGAPAAQA